MFTLRNAKSELVKEMPLVRNFEVFKMRDIKIKKLTYEHAVVFDFFFRQELPPD